MYLILHLARLGTCKKVQDCEQRLCYERTVRIRHLSFNSQTTDMFTRNVGRPMSRRQTSLRLSDLRQEKLSVVLMPGMSAEVELGTANVD